MTIYYVRKSGNDANDGLSEGQAKLTIASAISASANGDTLDIGEGAWSEDVTALRNYQGAGMFKTTITGAVGGTGSNVFAYRDMKVIANNNPNSLTYLTLERCWLDLSAMASVTRLFGSASYGEFVFTASIIQNPNATTWVDLRSTGSIIKWSKCTFVINNANAAITTFVSLPFSSDSFIKNCVFYGLNCEDTNSQRVFSKIASTTQGRSYNRYFGVGDLNTLYTGEVKETTTPTWFESFTGSDFRPAAGSALINAGQA